MTFRRPRANTKTNYQITNSADQPLTVTWIAMLLPVNAPTFGKNSRLQRAGTQIVSDAAEQRENAGRIHRISESLAER